ncbi:uncharacterized protein [Amphiura filiformis]|uniref:uncharacterized protein n=1 Tax=Amphiura filiformis TaxID=82378 RepID=UPI003B21A445
MTSSVHVTISKILPILLVLLALLLDKNRVSGQSLQIKFESIGEYDYMDGKAFLEGSQVHLLCDISGQIQASHTVVFKRDGVKLSSNESILVPNSPLHFFVQNNLFSTSPYRSQFKLFIYDVSKEDQGFYSCHVEDSIGNVVVDGQYTNTAAAIPRIVVLYLPNKNRYPACSVVEGTIDVKIGSKINLRCTSELGNPQVELTWKRSTSSGSNDDVVGSVSMSDDEMTYNVPPITITQESDGDIFTCFMKPNTTFFPSGLRTCDVGPLNVISDVPLPIITPLIQNAVPGDTVSFQCALPGQTNAQFSWFWDPNWVFNKSPLSPDTKTFSLRNVRSYHHLTKVYCKTLSEGVEVSVYGLIRVNGPYEAPPNTPTPSVTKPAPKPGGGGMGNGETGGSDGGNGGTNGGSSVTSPSGSNGQERTTRSKGKGVLIQAANIKIVLTCLFLIVISDVICKSL